MRPGTAGLARTSVSVLVSRGMKKKPPHERLRYNPTDPRMIAAFKRVREKGQDQLLNLLMERLASHSKYEVLFRYDRKSGGRP
jgi:hypothetical protein